jgi:hypothetical protein
MRKFTSLISVLFLMIILTLTAKPQYNRSELLGKSTQKSVVNKTDNQKITQSPVLNQVPAEYKNHPEFGKTQPVNPHQSGSYELIHKRTVNTRLFQNLNGTYITAYSTHPLHFQDEKGWWITIDEETGKEPSLIENIEDFSTLNDLTIINSCFYPSYQESSLTISIPAGDNILSTYILWEFTAVNSGWLSDQKSYVSGPLGQTTVFTGSGNVMGTQVYTTSDPIANIVSPGQITINFYSTRTWGGSGCNTTYNFLQRRYIEVLHGEIQYGEGDIVINEYSASNLATISDNYSEYEDWIELYNPSEFWVDISGYYLSDRVNNPTKWQFPQGVIMPPGGFLRVWASGRNEVAGGNYHTNFKLTQTKDVPENIVLSLPDGTIRDSLQIQPTQMNHSRGRQPNGGETWRIFTSPTPGTSNNSASGYIAYAQKPVMSEIAGFYNNPLSIAITTSEPNSTIRYSTNGTEPTTGSTLYTQPVAVTQTRIVIARTFSNNPQILPSLLDFNTYFINVDHTLGAMSISAGQLQQLLNGNQSLRPFGTFEYFNAEGVRTTYGYGEFNEHGQDSWVHPQRSIDYITRDECGYNYAIREKLIPFTDRNEYQRIIIRAQGDDNYPGIDTSAHLRDLFIENFAIKGGMNLDGRRGQQGVMYANGDYWGVYGFREKVDHDFSDYYYNQDKYNLYNIKIWGSTWAEYGGQAAFDDWYALRGFILNNNMTNQANYEFVKTKLDYESFVDYLHVNSFVVCTDWINWNVSWWKGLNPDGGIQRWRYTLWDEDATFNHYINYTGVPGTSPLVSPCFPQGITADPGQHIAVLNKLLTNPEFKRYYVSRYIDLYNTVFRPDNLIPYLNQIETEMLPEMPRHFTRWGGNLTKWQSNVQKIRNFINARYAYLPTGLASCYNLTGPYPLTLDVYPAEAGKIRINSIIPEEYAWNGSYFGGIETQLEAIASSPYKFSHWEVSGTAITPGPLSPVITLNLSQNATVTAHFYNPLTDNELVHYWHFNSLPSGTLTSVTSDFSANTPGAITYPGTGAGYMDRRTHTTADPVSNLNLQMGQLPDQGAVLRVRNPSDTRELVIAASTAGFKEIVVAFATTRTTNGAQIQEFYWSSDNGTNWNLQESAYSVPILTQWELKAFDLSSITALDNNPNVQFRILFTGGNASLAEGNNRFDNLTVMGIPTANPVIYYSKATGPLESLSTWGTLPDGTGNSPANFSADYATYNLRNRTTTVLSNSWTVTGFDSRVVAGDGINSIVFTVNAPLFAKVEVSNLATLTLSNQIIPDLAELHEGSAVIYTGMAQNVPYTNFHHLTFSGVTPVFNGNGTITIGGNLNLTGTVNMPDARGSSEYSFMFAGYAAQQINTGGNVLRSYNMIFVKTQGSIGFAGGSTISSDNQLTFNIGADAAFSDNGITIYAGNSVSIAGAENSYLFTGTLILAGSEPGIVKGSGAGNNFNIRQGDNTNPVAPLNNLVVRVANTGGEFRFRDGTTNTFTIKGDFIVEGSADGLIRFYQNDVFIGSDFIVEEGFAGSIEPLKSLTLNGTVVQNVQSIPGFHVRDLILDNFTGIINLSGTIEVDSLLSFVTGKLVTYGNGLLIIGLDGEINGFDDQKYIEGAMGFRANNIIAQEFTIPIGKAGAYRPVVFEVTHLNNEEMLYVAEIFEVAPPLLSLPTEIDWVSDSRYYRINSYGTGQISAGKITLTYGQPEINFDPELLRIVRAGVTAWEDLGGNAIGTLQGSVTSTEYFTSVGIFALAKAASTPIERNLNLKVMLEGAYAAGIQQMSNTLNLANYIPLTQPYFAPPWNYQGTESVTSVPNENIVDWILIGFLDATTVENALPATMFDRRAAFLLQDGIVTDLDGTSTLHFTGTISQNLFVVVWHRNHLGVISALPVQETGDVYMFDFSSGPGQALGGINAQKEVDTGLWAIIAGDLNSDGLIDLTDKITIWEAEAGLSGYLDGDTNLDGETDNKDKDDFWEINLNRQTYIPD